MNAAVAVTLRAAAVAAWCLVLCSGCSLMPKRDRVIALPEDSTVRSLQAGDPAPFSGFLVGRARFAQLAPCFREQLQSPHAGRTESVPPAETLNSPEPLKPVPDAGRQWYDPEPDPEN